MHQKYQNIYGNVSSTSLLTRTYTIDQLNKTSIGLNVKGLKSTTSLNYNSEKSPYSLIGSDLSNKHANIALTHVDSKTTNANYNHVQKEHTQPTLELLSSSIAPREKDTDSKTDESYTVNSIDDNQDIPFAKPSITNNDVNHNRSQEDTLTTRNWSNNENRDALS